MAVQVRRSFSRYSARYVSFVKMLHSEIAKWLETQLSLSHQAVHLYMEGLQGWLSDRNIPAKDGSAVVSLL